MGEKWRDGRWLRGSMKTENRMEGWMPRLELPLSAEALLEDEAAMTVPVVADLDLVILRGAVVEDSSWEEVGWEEGASWASFCDWDRAKGGQEASGSEPSAAGLGDWPSGQA